MWHPTEDELIQHLCGETDARDRARMDAHVAECEECRLACAEITGALTMVTDAVPEPPDGFERVVWARVQQALADEPRPSRWTWRAWVPAGAVAAMAIVGVALVNRPDQPAVDAGSQAGVIDAAADDRARNRVLYTALDSHFQQTEMLLVELRNASEGASLDYERLSADDLVSAGRLYRVNAEHAGYDNWARLFDELEPVLVEVARGPERLEQQDRAWIRARIDDEALLFKVRAATNDIRDRVGHPVQ